MATSIAKEGK